MFTIDTVKNDVTYFMSLCLRMLCRMQLAVLAINSKIFLEDK